MTEDSFTATAHELSDAAITVLTEMRELGDGSEAIHAYIEGFKLDSRALISLSKAVGPEFMGEGKPDKDDMGSAFLTGLLVGMRFERDRGNSGETLASSD